MIEIVSRVVGHAEALHDATRALIGRDRQGNDIAQADFAEAEIERGSGGLGRVTSAPIGPYQTPSDLHGRGEVGFIRDRLETDDADEARLAREFNHPLPEAVLLPMGALPSHPSLDRKATARQWHQVFHDGRIARHLRERR